MNNTHDDDGGPIAPILSRTLATGEHVTEHTGMSLRDYFAGMALQGLLANPDPVDAGSMKEIMAELADKAYGYATAMIAARKDCQP